MIPTNIEQLSQREEKKPKVLTLRHSVDTETFEHYLMNRISGWYRLVRVVAWLRRPLIDRSCRTVHLSAVELEQAKLSLFFIAQVPLISAEAKKTREKLNLAPTSDESKLLRIHGRLSNFASRAEATKPIALPASSGIVRLFAKSVHQPLSHQG